MPTCTIEVRSRIVGQTTDAIDPILLDIFDERITVAELIARTVTEQISHDALAYPQTVFACLIARCQPDALLDGLKGDLQDNSRLIHSARYFAIGRIAAQWTLNHPTNYAIDQLCRSFEALCANPYLLQESTPDNVWYFWDHWEPRGYRPCLSGCLHVLELLVEHPQVADLLERIVRDGLAIDPPSAGTDTEYARKASEGYQQRRSSLYEPLAKALCKVGRLDYSLFRAVALRESGMIDGFCFKPDRYQQSTLSGYDQIRAEYSRQLARELAEDFRPEYAAQISHYYHYRGTYFLVKACAAIERLQVKKLTPFSYTGTVGAALGRMAKIMSFLDGDDLSAAVTALMRFKQETLEVIHSAAGIGEPLVLQAMGKEQLFRFVQLIYRLGHYTPEKHEHEVGVQNCDDPTEGVLDVPRFRALVEQIGREEIIALLERMHKGGLNIPGALMLTEAALGEHRDELLKKAQKRNQDAVKAYGLLPLQSDDEVLERYLFFKQFAKESKQFGPDRQANERAAAQVGLTNLAQVAGYEDAVRLEWAMEARISQQAESSTAPVAVGDYQLRLAIEPEGLSIIAGKDGKDLKSVPPPVKKSDDYKQLAELRDQLRAQASRFKTTLEEMMVTESVLTLDAMSDLIKLPMARPLLATLIFQLDGGDFGIFDPETQTFASIGDVPLPMPQQVRIAHAWHLFQAQVLAKWQRAIVRKRIVQPFKQAFRELYILTPAEEDTAIFSNRFVGHTLNPKVATKLFQSRGWQMLRPDYSDIAEPAKIFHRLGMQAIFSFPDAGHFLSETDSITSDSLQFMPYPFIHDFRTNPAEHRLPLVDIPPIILSEVMRDADLVVSVAQQEEKWQSGEITLRRGELTRMLVEDLGVTGVTVDGHFAYVQGKLARYRVHLSSAVIHFEPGSYLCIVPDRWGEKTANLFLPFADVDDAKLCEVVSKILLLINDDKIKDASITQQIAQHVQQQGSAV
jgi:hypothetical protein